MHSSKEGNNVSASKGFSVLRRYLLESSTLQRGLITDKCKWPALMTAGRMASANQQFFLAGVTRSGNAEKLQISACSAPKGAKKGEESRSALWGL